MEHNRAGSPAIWETTVSTTVRSEGGVHGIGGGVHIQWLYYHPGHEGAAQVSEVEHNRGVMTQVTGFSFNQVNSDWV